MKQVTAYIHILHTFLFNVTNEVGLSSTSIRVCDSNSVRLNVMPSSELERGTATWKENVYNASFKL